MIRLWTGGKLPASTDMPVLEGIEFQVIKHWEPEIDGCSFAHGIALAWHNGRFFSSFGFNQGRENTEHEQAMGFCSCDGGRTWQNPLPLAKPCEKKLGISHGAFLSYGGNLWAFLGSFYGNRSKVHTRAYLLDEKNGKWIFQDIVIKDGFWPMQQPLQMANGNWIMAGIRCVDMYDDPQNQAAVAISHGSNLTEWDLVVIPNQAPGKMWAESTIYISGANIFNIARWQEKPFGLVAQSHDFGRTWTSSRPSNLPLAASKPYTGTLSTTQHYLIGTTTPDSGNLRRPLTIALSRSGETTFSSMYVIRHAENQDAAVESAPDARLSYPYAIEYDKKLYVGYSNCGGRHSNRNSLELAIIPLASLQNR